METQPQQQQAINSSPYQSPMHNFGSSIIFLTNPETSLGKMEDVFRGVKRTQDGLVTPVYEPLMNDRGTSEILGLVQSLCNQVTVLSDYDDKKIDPIMLNFCDVLIKTLMYRWREFEINPARRHVIRSQIVEIGKNYALSSIFRAKSGGERRFWKGSTQEIITTPSQQPSSLGKIGRAFGWK